MATAVITQKVSETTDFRFDDLVKETEHIASEISSSSNNNKTIIYIRDELDAIQRSRCHLIDHHNIDPKRIGLKTLDDNKQKSSFRPALIKKLFSLSPTELGMNSIQLTILFVMTHLIKIPSVANFVTSLLQTFPYNTMHDYEKLSPLNWAVHYAGIGYNIGVIQRLFIAVDNSSDTNKRRLYALFVTGIGHLLGVSLLISHSLIGEPSISGRVAGQALYNFSQFLITFSALSIGGTLLLSTKLSIPFSISVAHCIMNETLSFTNLPGILLANFGLLAVALSNFPLMLKIGYVMLSLSPLVVKLVEDFIDHPGTDLGHMIGAAWIFVATIVQRFSLRANEDKSIVNDN